MARFWVRGVRVDSLEEHQLEAILARAEPIGGSAALPILASLRHDEPEVDPERLADELRTLALSIVGTDEAHLLGLLRDHLFEALAASEEG